MSTSLVELTSDPVRLAIVRTLADRGTTSLSELADAAGVHPNTARPHVAELERAGAIVRSHSGRSGRGRPIVLYELAGDWALPDRGATDLAELLAALVQRLDPDPSEVDELGRQWGRFLGGRPGAREPGGGLAESIERLGFEVEQRGDELRLRGCPCPLVSPQQPELICRLTTAVADGLASSSDERRRVASSRHEPSRRSCALKLSSA